MSYLPLGMNGYTLDFFNLDLFSAHQARAGATSLF